MTAPGEDGTAGSGTIIVVLGCRPAWGAEGCLVGALGRRVRAPLATPGSRSGRWIVSGGRSWDGVIEADAMRDELLRAGVREDRVLRERCSMTTWDNARFTAQMLARFEGLRVTLATCDWHMPRAVRCFGRHGVAVDPLPVRSPDGRAVARLRRAGHEWISMRLSFHTGSHGTSDAPLGRAARAARAEEP